MRRVSRWRATASTAAIAALLLAGCGQPMKAGPTAGPPVLSAKGLSLKSGEASPQGRLLIGRGKDYTPIAEDPAVLFTSLEGSMEKRRQTAWKIVEAMLEPQMLTVGGVTYEVPLWHTWYEGMSSNAEVQGKISLFIAELAACRADPDCDKSRAEIAREVVSAAPQKNLVRSLVSDNMTQVLRQSQGGENNPGTELGRGFTLFSPAFVEHVLTEAQGVETCSDKIPWDQAPPSASQFSPCISEFPRSAVMVKTSWTELAPANPQAASHPTDAAAITSVINGGTWPAPRKAAAPPGRIYTVETTNGRRFGLQSIHFSTKDTREWVWISLWWDPAPDTDFGQDRPTAIARFNGGVWKHYKMCVTTAFNEKDAEPWRTYLTGSPALAASIKASYDAAAAQKGPAPYDKVTTWCSNPNLEHHVGNGVTNCIGCHQYPNTWNRFAGAATEFDDTYNPAYAAIYPQYGRDRRRLNFPAEFAWSFPMEFAGQIKDAREAQGFNW